jgi:pyruvate,water dikinase
MAYRLYHNIDPFNINQAVIVQQMIAANAAGILFTANPINGEASEVLINAAWGLGESVVSGRVTPDTMIVDKATAKVKEIRIATKSMMTTLAEHGTMVVPVELAKQQQLAISTEQASKLAHWGKALESHFGTPQDVEWAICGDEFYILQSRPLTACDPRADNSRPAQPLNVNGNDNWPALGNWSRQPFDLWTRTNMGELWPDPVSPLVASASPMIVSQALCHSLRGVNAEFLNKVQWVKRFYGRFYFNEGALAYLFSHELGLPDSFIDRALGNRRRDIRPYASQFCLLQFFRRLPIVVQLAIRQQSTGRKLEALFPQITQRVTNFFEQNCTECGDRELWREALVWLDYIQQVRTLQLEMTGLSMTAVSTLERLTLHWLDRQDLARDLITGLAGIEAAEIGSALWQMAQKIRELDLGHLVMHDDAETALRQLHASAAAAPVLRMFDRFLERHGHRCPNEEEWLHPRWAEAPAQVIELIKAYGRANSQLDPQRASCSSAGAGMKPLLTQNFISIRCDDSFFVLFWQERNTPCVCATMARITR